jgi:hypothetical protein
MAVHQQDRHQGDREADPGGMACRGGCRGDGETDHRGEGESRGGHGLGGEGERVKTAVQPWGVRTGGRSNFAAALINQMIFEKKFKRNSSATRTSFV